MSGNKLYRFSVNNESFVFNGNTFGIFNAHNRNIPIGEPIPLRNFTPSLRTLVLTICNNCNLACEYCYANQGNWDAPGENMSEEVAFASIDLLLGEVKRSNGDLATISFFGGEPLLRFNFIKKVVDYAERKSNGIKLRFAVVTNGTLLDEEKRNFFSKKGFIVSLSLDGNREQHDQVRIHSNREGSYDELVENSTPLLNKTPVLVRATASDHNVDILESIKSIRSLGFDRMSYEIDDSISKEGFETHLDNTEELLSWYIDRIKNKDYFDFRNITRVVAQILLKLRSKSHCNAGIGYMAVSAEGDLYFCHRFIGEKDLSRGNVLTITPQYLEKVITEFDYCFKDGPGSRHKECVNCPFQFLCGGICLYQAYTKTGRLFSIAESSCRFKRHFFDQGLRFICALRGEKLKEFVDFLTDLWQNEDQTNFPLK